MTSLMTAFIDADSEIRAANRIAFDTLSDRLRKQLEVTMSIKEEIKNMQNKAINLRSYILSYDRIYEDHKQLYNMYVATFLSTLAIYLGVTDSQHVRYIPPVTDTSKTTDVDLVIRMPSSTETVTITNINNISVDTVERDIKIGNLVLNVLSAEDLASQFSSIQEVPTPYYSREEFIAGIKHEAEKLMQFYHYICRNELLITACIRYINELKSIGIY